jgi:hypothetical protein
MKPYDVYVFFLCLVVFTALTALFSYLIYEIIKLTVRVINNGLEDEKIIADYNKPVKSAGNKVFSSIVSLILCGFLMVSFGFSLWLHFSEDVFTNISTLKVVASSSMAEKHKRNTYLFENNLDNQFNTFDLIVTHPVPDEFELELYDVVVYEYEDMHIIHRIVKIEEPNNKHPEHRLFTLQGDAISSPDRDPVTYDQIKAIYKDQRVPFVGSFVFFMKSPAGWLCVLLVLFAIIATPIVEKKIRRETMLRLYTVGIITVDELNSVNSKKAKKAIDKEE